MSMPDVTRADPDGASYIDRLSFAIRSSFLLSVDGRPGAGLVACRTGRLAVSDVAE